MFIGLNPSYADEDNNDVTITRCISYAEKWGYGGIIVGNLFALISTSPKRIKEVDDPVGPRNDFWLKKLRGEADIVVAIWGNSGAYLGRAEEVCLMFPKLHCLGITKRGYPHHTRGLPRGVKPIAYRR